MLLPFEEHEDEGSEPVPGDDSTDPASDDGNVHPVSHQVSQPTEVTGKLPRDCCIPERSSATSNMTPMAHNVTAGEQSDTKSPPQDTQSSDSSQSQEEDFNLSSPSPAEYHSSSALGLPRSTPSEFSVQQTPQQGTSRPLDFDVQSLPSECATPYMQSVEEGQQKEKQEEEEEEEEELQVHSVFHSSEHPHFPHCLPAQSGIVYNPPPSQPSTSSDVYTVSANYACGHGCNRAAQSLPTIQCNGSAQHLCVYNPPPSCPSRSSHVYLSKPVQQEDCTAMDCNKASKHVLVCGQTSESKASCSSRQQDMLVCGKETRERNYEQKCELFSTTLSSATATHMPLPCPLPQDLPTASAMSKSVDVDEAECVTSEDNSSQDAKRCPAAEPSAAVPPDIMQNHAISESDDSLEANEDQVNPSPPVRRKNKRRRGRKK